MKPKIQGVILLALALLIAATTAGVADAAERRYIRDDRGRIVGDLYDPGWSRDIQVRDRHRRIKFFIESDGDVKDSRGRKVGTVEDLGEILEGE